jgi:transcriptional regulator with XRE-family HTH domain
MNFADWLQEELNKRLWTHAELARRCYVQTTQISRVIARKRKAGPDLCIAIAKGLNLPREEIFRARGWLLREPEKVFEPNVDPRAEELAKQVSTLPFESQEMTLDAMEAMLKTSHKLTLKIKKLETNGQENEPLPSTGNGD